MLIRLNIRNFALIDNLEIELSPGLNVLTGETGAGKSIIIDAMGVIIGAAALQEYIRTGEEKALVEALIDISHYPPVSEKVVEMGLESEDGILLLTRELQRNGKNLCRINGRPVTLSMYRQIGELLVDIYGQNHQQSLLKKEKHLTLLDSFGGDSLKSELNYLEQLATDYLKVKKSLASLRQDESDKAKQLDLYNFQLQEIDEAGLNPAEEEGLMEERNLLANAEKLSELADMAHRALYSGDAGQLPALDLMHKSLAALRDLAAIDPAMDQTVLQLEEALYQVEDCAREMGRYRENINFDPQRLDLITERIDKIGKLKRKYGSTIAEILQYREEIAAAVQQLNNADEEIERLTRELNEIYNSYSEVAGKVSGLRKATAQHIQEEICRELKDLNMPEVKFEVGFQEREEVSGLGFDDVEFLISPNPGEPLKPLSKIASGGEVSRIMLAMKTILARVDEIPTLIFDEIDAGLGGSALQAVARKLAFIGQRRQVICVTHSAQIASHAAAHFNISKKTEGNRTVTRIYNLSGEERVREIARMLGGNNMTPTALKNASEMLEMARQF